MRRDRRLVMTLRFDQIPFHSVVCSCALAPDPDPDDVDPDDVDEAGTAVAADVIDPSSLSSSLLVVELSCQER